MGEEVGKGFPCLWQFFATFLYAKGGEEGGATKVF